ncbi:MAG: hypothetical protein EKK53_17660 [Burkholderiales bacterium]|nr:MAG: hypothetical protein EKK53_17660 [Burkholderiales bacterium]
MLTVMDAALVDAELARLAASAPFRRAHRHLRFLRHLLARVQAGDQAALREMALGVAVFHRRADQFDPRSDSIVRVEARRLRRKLADYYASEGRDAPVEFALPVGSYQLEVRLRHRPPVPEAVHLGRTALALGTLPAIQRAVELAEQALVEAPELGLAWLLKSAALVAAVGLTTLPAPGAMPAARDAARRALADPLLPDAERAEAHGLLALVAFSHDRHWPDALAEVRRAQALAPSAQLRAREGWMLMFAGHFAGARKAYAAARALDPLSLTYRVHEALISLYERDYPRAAASFDDVLSVAPGHLMAQSLSAALHLYAGRHAEGAQAYRRLIDAAPTLSIGLCGLAQGLALVGDTAAAEQAFAELLARFEAGTAPPYQLAMVRARLQDAPGALRWLDRAAELHDFNLVCAAVDPAFDSLRHLPEFGERLQAWGLAAIPDGAPIMPA